VLARQLQPSGDFRLAKARGGDDVLPENDAGMSRATCGSRRGVVSFVAISVILLEVELQGILAIELEGDAPGSVDMDGVARRNEAAERMEVETWILMSSSRPPRQ